MSYESIEAELASRLASLETDYRKKRSKKLYKQLDGATISKYVGSTGIGDGGNEGMPTFTAVLSNGRKVVLQVSGDQDGSSGGYLLGLKLPRENKRLLVEINYLEKLIAAHKALREN